MTISKIIVIFFLGALMLSHLTASEENKEVTERIKIADGKIYRQ